MILTFSKDMFVYAIKSGRKVHTIREDRTRRWKSGRSIQFWRGNPRNVHAKVKPYEFLVGECKGVEEIEICRAPQHGHLTGMAVSINGRYLGQAAIHQLAENDGLTIDQFRLWFVPPKSPVFRGRIIHWTDLTYTS